MSGLLDMLSQQLGGGMVQQISSQIGADTDSTQKAIGAALPMLLGGLARNANSSPESAQSLARALDQDHDGSVLDNLSGLLGGAGGGLLGSLLGGGGSGGAGDLLGSMLGGGGGGSALNPRALNGDGILKHILGGKRGAVEQGISKASGLDLSKVGPLLAALAPVVMGALGKMKKQNNMSADDLTATLNRERADIEEKAPGMSRGGLLSMLDSDNDGSIADDVAKMGAALGGAALLGKMFGKQ